MKRLMILVLLVNFTVLAQDQIKEIKDNFYFELATGSGLFFYKSHLDEAYKNNFCLNLSASFYYRNKYVKTGFEIRDNYIYDNLSSTNIGFSYRLGFNGNFFNEKPQFYLGPYFGVSEILGIYDFKIQHLKYFSFVFGLDFYYKKFHIELAQTFYNKNIIYFDYFSTHEKSLILNIGYAFNLESFRKKK